MKWNCDPGYTFVNQNGASVIDYFVMSCSMSSKCTDIKLSINEFVDSDHLPIQLTLYMQSEAIQTQEIPSISNQKPTEKTVWDKDKENIYMNTLTDDVGLALLKEATDQIDVDVNASLLLFTQCLLRASECMKKKVFPANSSKRPGWFDEECKLAKKECRKHLREYRKTRKSIYCICSDKRLLVLSKSDTYFNGCFCQEKRLTFVESRKAYRKLLKQKKQQFRLETAENLCKNINVPNLFWNDVKKLGLRNKSRSSDTISIEEWFRHFQKLFSVDEDVQANTADTGSTVEEDEDHVLNQEIRRQEVEEAIKKIKCGKASGSDGIVGEMLKSGGRTVTNFLTLLFNKIFDDSIYPEEWSKAIVVPIFKKGNVDDPNNYRGVSLKLSYVNALLQL